jgi:hypothetical protein
MKRSRLALALGALVIPVSLSACGSTTVVDVPTVPTTVPEATTTLPAGTPTELTARLRDLGFTLSAGISVGRSEAQQILDELVSLWGAAKSQLPRTQFVEDVQHQLDIMQIAVDRRRPADADKAALHIRALVNAELDKAQGS